MLASPKPPVNKLLVSECAGVNANRNRNKHVSMAMPSRFRRPRLVLGESPLLPLLLLSLVTPSRAALLMLLL